MYASTNSRPVYLTSWLVDLASSSAMIQQKIDTFHGHMESLPLSGIEHQNLASSSTEKAHAARRVLVYIV